FVRLFLLFLGTARLRGGRGAGSDGAEDRCRTNRNRTVELPFLFRAWLGSGERLPKVPARGQRVRIGFRASQLLGLPAQRGRLALASCGIARRARLFDE